MKVEQLTILEGRQLLDKLQRDSDPRTLGIRGFIHTITSGRASSGNIFVDQWPNFAHIACITDGKEIFKHIDMDYCTVYSENTKRKDFINFMDILTALRNWERRPIIMSEILEYQKLDIQHALVKNPFGVREIGCWRAVKIDPDFKFDEARKLPNGFKLDPLKPSDAQVISENWGYGVFAEQVQYFVWTINNLPQICIRDSAGKPIAWGLEYQMGSGAARFTLPEYRRTGMGYVLDRERLKLHSVTSKA